MFKKLGLYYRTIKHLKPIQIRYRLWYSLRNRFRNLIGHTYPLSIPKEGHVLHLTSGIPRPSTSGYCFNFLNQSHTFIDGIDWNFSKYGKLWAYNLNYFDYLLQPTMTKKKGLKLIQDFIDQMESNREGMEPYPISLRGINWIKFLSRYEIKDHQIDSSLYAQYQILLDNIEYHLLGNHLLENGCSLLFGACYFRDKELYKTAEQILDEELKEQILSDGGHFERSTMYHCIMHERLLDCYNLVVNNNWDEDQELKVRLEREIELMLGWLKKMEWRDGSIPEVNDYVVEMPPPNQELYSYADRMGLAYNSQKLGASGYRKYGADNYEFLTDVGNIGPDYVPGHAHSDTFSFLLCINDKEIITDTGTSTYENNQRRQTERSTAAHNTVMIEGKEQNEVWSAFRVGRRGHVEILKDESNEIIAQHDGYQFMGVMHERRFKFEADEIEIRDLLKGGNNRKKATFHLHFSPNIEINQHKNIIEGNGFTISFNGHSSINLGSYKKATGYNKCNDAVQAAVNFSGELKTKIKIR